MAVPKRRTSKSRRDKRRSHLHLTAPSLSTCPQCHEPVMPHRICPSCGSYKGKPVLVTEEV
ncbi:MAG: 50S ribosomal protein L32 [Desulfosoma sp.]|uniref:50S ribosomal protein L32 n=1 Tax=Desulfosoma sp. TaxID=2603217 RepID=UPI00404B1557